MEEIGDRILTNIQTHRGDVDINHMCIGDIVYDFNSGQEHTVRAVKKSRVEDIYQVDYSDGRSIITRETELVYAGGMITCVRGLLEEMQKNKGYRTNPQFGEIKQQPIDYNMNKIVPPLEPDPYAAGALIMHGNMNSKYINLPWLGVETNSYFLNKYKLIHGYEKNGYVSFFTYKGDISDKRIEWTEFFPRYSLMNISDEYKRASIEDRWKFVRGAFDIGYNTKTFPDDVGMICRSLSRLLNFQKLLWSIGIISTIRRYIDREQDIHDIRYLLEVHCDPELYPNFFYHQSYTEYFLEKNQKLNRRSPILKLRIQNIQKIGRGYSKRIVLDNIGTKFLTDNFLPKVSV